MFAFISRNRIPSGGKFYYEVPETKVFLESYQSFDDLIAQVGRHYVINKLTVPVNLSALVEDYMCRHLPAGSCTGDDGGIPVRTRPLSYFSVVEKLENYFRRKPALGTAEEAEKRSALCFHCERNWLGMCVSCNGLKGLAFHYAGYRKVVREQWMGVCHMTTIPINAMLFVKDPDFGVVTDCPSHCWVLRKDAV